MKFLLIAMMIAATLLGVTCMVMAFEGRYHMALFAALNVWTVWMLFQTYRKEE